MPSTVIVTIGDDGTIKTNAKDMVGTEAEILEALTDLANEVGGELTVEKHVGGTHVHSHGEEHHHHKIGK